MNEKDITSKQYCDVCKCRVRLVYYKEKWICEHCGSVIKKMNEELTESKIKEIKAMEKQVIERITEPERWEE